MPRVNNAMQICWRHAIKEYNYGIRRITKSLFQSPRTEESITYVSIKDIDDRLRRDFTM